MRPKVAGVVAAAQEQGKLRPDLATLDIPLIELMLAEVMQLTAEVAPDVWRRLFTYVIDGMMASRSEPTPLDASPITAEDIPVAMERSGRRPPQPRRR